MQPAAVDMDDPAQLRRALRDRDAELADAHDLMRATLESTADGVVVAGADGRITAFNEKFLELSGLERAELEPGSLALVRERVPHLFARGRPEPDAARLPSSEGATELLQLADGRVFERYTCRQRIDGQGESRVFTYRDVTTRRHAEDALRDEAEVLHFLNATGATTAAMLDVEGLLQTVIDAATKVSGASFGAFFYRDVPVRDLSVATGRCKTGGDAAPVDGTPMIALSGVARSRSEAFDPSATAAAFGDAWHGDHTLRCADVSQLPVPQDADVPDDDVNGAEPAIRSFLAVPVTLRCGMTVGGLFLGHPDAGVFDERTQRIAEGVAAHAAIALDNARLVDGMRRAAQDREQLVAAERRARADSMRAARIKDEFLATLSHELRTPLTAILGWANVLQLGRSDPGLQTRGLEAIVRNANAQVELIKDLLEMGRIMSGKVRLEVRPTDLAYVVDAALDAVRSAAEAKAITLVRHVAPAGCHVVGDPARLQQLVWNLLSNAVKFTPRRGRVEAAVARTDGEVMISVSDTGQGIDPAFLPHVFDHFTQADASTTRRHGGLGLGLAIVRQLAALHGGTVNAHSEGPGRGARFEVRLPCGDVRPDEAAEGRHRPVARPARQARGFSETDLAGVDVLVVDDQSDARELVAQLLVECGASVRQAASAAEAIREIAAQRPDVLLSDIGMPERDGYELIQEIRRLPVGQGRNVPAIALTAFARPEDQARALQAGYQRHLAKPIQPQELVSAVACLAGRATSEWKEGH